MKKRTILAVTLLTLTCLGGQTITTQAAAGGKIFSNGKGIIVAYGSGCNIQSIFDKLENCFPNISLPETNIPETESPEVNVPEAGTPETEIPEVDMPETEAPEMNVPEADTPETEAPEVNVPEADTPETEAPEVNIPENSTPDNNTGNDSTEEGAPEDDTAGEHAFIKEVVNLVNAERAKEGLSPLTINLDVQAAAMVRAKECEQVFSHTRPDGTSFATALKEQGVSYRSAGENIAWGQRSPEEVMQAWMNSSGHRANIMNPNFTTIGVGYYENANGTDYWCQLFTR